MVITSAVSASITPAWACADLRCTFFTDALGEHVFIRTLLYRCIQADIGTDLSRSFGCIIVSLGGYIKRSIINTIEWTFDDFRFTVLPFPNSPR